VAKSKHKLPEGATLVAQNKKARAEYALGDRVEAGMVLSGSEVKSCRAGKVQLNEAFVRILKGEAFLCRAHIAEYEGANQFNHVVDRERKLLLHRREIDRLAHRVQERGLSIVPTVLYLRAGRLKLEIAVGTGKAHADKRHAVKEREVNLEIRRALRRGR
jgi:SsrA-binding protein